MILKIGICIPTYNRQEYLEQLLKYIKRMEFEKNKELEIYTLVIDNDENRTSEDIVSKYSTKYNNIYYFVQENKGYSSVRNRCLLEAENLKCEYIAFIDDDEYPDKYWLDKLITTMLELNADAVFGPVLPVYEAYTPKWIKKGGFFEKASIEDKELVSFSNYRTSNVLIRCDSIKNLFFDMHFNKLGGEDTKFFYDMNKRGNSKLIWCQQAEVYEYVPLVRTRTKWFLKRAFNNGQSSALFDRINENNFKSNFIIIIKACYNILSGLLSLILAIILGYDKIVKSLRKISRGLGRINGFLKLKI